MVNWHEITPLSRVLAIIVFLGLVPALSFYLGMEFRDTQETRNVMRVYPMPRLEVYSRPAPTAAPLVTASTTQE